MQDIITFIKNLINIPYIEDDDAVMDGSFAVTPYSSSALKGDGAVKSLSMYYSVECFYRDKGTMMTAMKNIYKNLHTIKGYSSGPSFSYDKNSGYWQGIINIERLED